MEFRSHCRFDGNMVNMANLQVVKPNMNSEVTFRPNFGKVVKSARNVLETHQRGLAVLEKLLGV